MARKLTNIHKIWHFPHLGNIPGKVPITTDDVMTILQVDAINIVCPLNISNIIIVSRNRLYIAEKMFFPPWNVQNIQQEQPINIFWGYVVHSISSPL